MRGLHQTAKVRVGKGKDSYSRGSGPPFPLTGWVPHSFLSSVCRFFFCFGVKLLNIFQTSFYMYVRFACVLCVPGAFRGPEQALDSLESWL